MEAILTNIELIIVAGALVANFIINISKKVPSLKPTNDKIDLVHTYIKEDIKQLMEQVKLNRRDSLRGLIYSKAPTLNRMVALDDFIRLGFNHECLDFAIKDFIVGNKELWYSVLNQRKDEPIHDKERYEKSLKKIEEIIR
jgi:hypothetical protein